MAKARNQRTKRRGKPGAEARQAPAPDPPDQKAAKPGRQRGLGSLGKMSWQKSLNAPLPLAFLTRPAPRSVPDPLAAEGRVPALPSEALSFLKEEIAAIISLCADSEEAAP